MARFNRGTDTGLQHLNGNLLCALDLETTGLDPKKHDIIEVAIVPLDAFYKPLTTIMPFVAELKPTRPENISQEAIGVNKNDIARLMQSGLDAFHAADLLELWFERIELASGKQIAVLGHNWPFDRAFLIEWLGWENFNHLFSRYYRDTICASLFLNDYADTRNEKVRYPKNSLEYLCTVLNVKNAKPHSALYDALATAECYRIMLSLPA